MISNEVIQRVRNGLEQHFRPQRLLEHRLDRRRPVVGQPGEDLLGGQPFVRLRTELRNSLDRRLHGAHHTPGAGPAQGG